MSHFYHGGETVVHTWYHIAKAEYFVLTSGMRKHRSPLAVTLFLLATLWAVMVAPAVIGALLSALIPMSQVRFLLLMIFPGVMRAAMMFLWTMLLLFPLSTALQEIKVGQWELFLSHKVKTRDIMTGTFLGKMPLYGLLVLFLSPLLISPFMMAFEVTLVGQVLVYAVIALLTITTIWLSNFITAVVQARLGDSSRGNDIAKALSLIVAMVVIIPMYGMMFFMQTLSQILGMNMFLLMPFTWTADLVSWLTIGFNGIGLTEPQIAAFTGVLQLNMLTNALLMGAFGLMVLIVGLTLADRVFTINAGARTEKVTTVGRENLLLRGIRAMSSGPSGTLIVVSLKDFGRKAQNLSKVFYGSVLALVMPIVIRQATEMDGDTFDFFGILVEFGLMIAILGIMPFAGTGFLESRDQLWMIQSAAKGASRFMKARLVSALLIALPTALIPLAAVVYIFGLTVLESMRLLIFAWVIVSGAVMVSIGVTARNPNYEDTKSSAHQTIMMTTTMLVMFSIMGPLFLDMICAVAGIDLFQYIRLEALMMLGSPTVLFSVGLLMMLLGTRSLSKPQA